MSRKKSYFSGKVKKDAERQTRAASNYGYLTLPEGVHIFNPEPGSRTTFDIMPYIVTVDNHPDRDEKEGIAVKDSPWFKRPFKVHRNVGVNDEAVVCLSSIGKKCPICEQRSKRRTAGADKDELSAMRPSDRNLYVVIPIDHKKFDEEPHIFDISQWCFQKLFNSELQEDEKYETFPDLEEGWAIKTRWAKESIDGGTAFAKANRIDFDSRDETYDESIMDDIPDLDSVLNILSYAELEAKWLEMEDDEKDTLDDDTPKKDSRKSDRKKKKLKKEEVEGDDKKEEEETPRRRSSKKESRRKKSEKEEDDDKCPHGHVFGKDCEKHDDCDDCELIDDCFEAQ